VFNGKISIMTTVFLSLCILSKLSMLLLFLLLFFPLYIQYVPPPLEELIDVNLCNAATMNLSQNTMCNQAFQQISSNIVNGNSITAEAAALACRNDMCRDIITSYTSACLRGVSILCLFLSLLILQSYTSIDM